MREVTTLVTAFWLGMGSVVSAAETPHDVSAGHDARAYPNPAHGVVHIDLGSAYPDSIIVPTYQLRVTVHGATGRPVRKLRDGAIDFGGGDHGEIAWDARTDSGRSVPSGFYYSCIVRNGQVSVRKVWIVW